MRSAVPAPVKLFAAILAAGDPLWEPLEHELEKAFGAIDERSRALSWSASAYYEREMGGGLLRRLFSFEILRSPEDLIEAKHRARSVEELYRSAGTGGRRANIDPGYLEAGKVVLASTKNANQRIYLGGGIYAEATLAYVGGAFVPYAYTYPDYQWPEVLEFFQKVRARYLEQLKAKRQQAKRPPTTDHRPWDRGRQ